MTDNKDSTRYYSSRQEENIAKLIGGRTVANSGAAKFTGGDVINDNFLVECKTTTYDVGSTSIKKEWLEKIKEEAVQHRRNRSALAFNFGPEQDSYFIIDKHQFREYNDLINQSKEENK